MHGLAGAIDASLGEYEGIEPVGRLATRDPAIGEIESGSFQIEEGVIGLLRRHQQSRRQPALAAREIGFELHEAVGIGALDREHLVAARHEPHLDVFDRGGRGQRMHGRMDAVIA